MNEMEIRRSDELEQLRPEQLGGEIRLLTSQARKIVLAYAVEIGHRLVLAKEKVAHGEWIDWVARETTLSQSGANRMMRLYEEYGSRQESLFGAEVNSSALTNLSISNALALLAVPAEEREQAAAELDAEHLSSRDLAEAIAARKAAEDRAQKAERALHEAEEGQGLALAELQEKLEHTQEGLAAALQKAAQAAEGVGPYKERAETAENTVAQLREQIKELEERPIATVKERDEEAIEQAVTAAKAKADAEAAEKISAIQKKLEKAEKDRDKFKDAAGKAESGAAEKVVAAEKDATAARQELEQLRRQLAASDKDVTEFILHSKQVQESFNCMFAALDRIAARDMTTAQKLNAGTIALLKRFADRCTGLSDRKSDAAPLPDQTVMGG